jgi:pimeloyl-ACP methyl ester carboxylesterase
VSGLVLLGSGPAANNDTMAELKWAVDALTDPIDPVFVREFQYSTVAQPVPDAFMNAAIANSLRMPAAVWKKAIAGLMQFEPLLPRSTVRTLVLGGTRDAVFTVREQVALAQQYPFARLRLIEDVGHALHWEQPDVFARELMQFVQ